MYRKSILDNNLRLITAEMPHTRSVSLGIFIGTGSRYEIGTQAGISHFIEHLLFKGTQKRATSQDISGAIEGVGGILNGGTDKEFTIYWCKVAQHHFSLALDVLVDILLHSRFDPEDIEKERQVIVEEISMYKDSPSQQVAMLIEGLLWSGHPLGRDIAGTKESVAFITRDMMLEYQSKQYLSSNAVIAVAGNIKHDEIISEVNETIGHWKSLSSRSTFLPYEPQPGNRLHLEKKDTEQAHLCLALPGLSLLHPKRFALDLLNVILGEGMSSRLFAEIRDKMGLAYSIHSYVDHFLDSGSIIVYAGVEPKNLSVAVKAILEQLALLKEPIPESELIKAKELSKGRLLLRMEDSRNVAGWAGGQEILLGDILSVDQTVAIIDAITTSEIQQIARELLIGSQLRLAVVGPDVAPQSLEELLKL